MLKKLIIGIFFFLFCANVCDAQQSTEQTALSIANRLKDTLGLSVIQKDSIYAINLHLNNQKSLVRSQYTQQDSIQKYIQRIESTRDNLYRQVFSDDNKYMMYKTKKLKLLANH